MELFQAKDHYILQSGDNALWCSRKDGSMAMRPATDLLLAWNPVCLGLVEGIIGKIQLHADLPLGLILIRQKALVGQLPGDHKVYKITKIVVIPLSEDEPQDLELELCKKHHFGIDKPEKITQSPDESKFLLKTLSQIKSNVAVPIKKKVKENKEKERLERRLLDELYKIFMDSDSFYYSLTYDLTNTVQRQGELGKSDQPLWKKVDDRFFWNKHMIKDLIDLQVQNCFSQIFLNFYFYDEEADKVNQYQRLSLEGLEKIEIGPEPTLFGKPKYCCMRLHYKNGEMSGYFHTLRAVTRNPEDDGKDTLQCIAEMLRITKQAMGLDVQVVEKKLEKVKGKKKLFKPHEDIMGIQGKAVDQVLGSGLAQGKSFLLNKFSTLNQKVKQTKTNVNIGNFKPLGKLGTFSKPEVKVNFLKPNLHMNLWKSDSSLETHDGNTGSAALKDLNDEHSEEISSDSDSYNSDEQPCSGSRENVDYVLPSCGIVASAPRLGSRSQSIGSVELAVPSAIRITGCDDKTADSLSVGPDGQSPGSASVAEEAILIDFGTPIDAYCHQFVQDAKIKPIEVFEEVAPAPKPQAPQAPSAPDAKLGSSHSQQQLPRPSQLEVESSIHGANLLTVQAAGSATSCGSQKSLEGVTGPSPADSNGSRVVSPFAKIRSSMVQVASLTQAGLTQGINFAVAKVQKSPEPDAVNETQENELRAMFTQCQTRIIQI
uniref:Phosphatidylinositide phosphatase SAC2 n=1 Tax=Sinocyclocheilus grahami TaxID=75366 RepID=A0A672L3Y2_SINGR